MANLSVEKLASVIGSTPELLLNQMQEAGLPSLIKCLYIARECRRVTTDTFGS